MMLLLPLVLPLAANNIFNFKMQLNLQQDDTSWFVLLSSICFNSFSFLLGSASLYNLCYCIYNNNYSSNGYEACHFLPLLCFV